MIPEQPATRVLPEHPLALEIRLLSGHVEADLVASALRVPEDVPCVAGDQVIGAEAIARDAARVAIVVLGLPVTPGVQHGELELDLVVRLASGAHRDREPPRQEREVGRESVNAICQEVWWGGLRRCEAAVSATTCATATAATTAMGLSGHCWLLV